MWDLCVFILSLDWSRQIEETEVVVAIKMPLSIKSEDYLSVYETLRMFFVTLKVQFTPKNIYFSPYI